MSLLLDALKKAADDKQRREAESSGLTLADTPSISQVDELSINNDELSIELDELVTAYEDDTGSEEILVLEEADDSYGLSLEPDEAVTATSVSADTETRVDGEGQKQSKRQTENNQDKAVHSISDEALSMLIHKTNNEVVKSKKIFISSTILISLTVLVTGGLYYYFDSQAEISAMERKHRISMQAMQARTSRERTPEELKIIGKLVNNAEADEKPETVREQQADNKPLQQSRKSRPVKAVAASGKKPAASALSITKLDKRDPVGEKLDSAWSAYESGNYGAAKRLYSQVLTAETNNRDALLGLGAIAVVEQDHKLAAELYQSLLKLDPADPIAIAALANLPAEAAALESNKDRLLTMLRHNPDAPHLNFALANIYAQQNKWRSAQQHYFTAWQHDSENADYIFNLAVSLDQLHKQQQAVGFYRDSLARSVNKQVGFSREAVRRRIAELDGL